MNTQNQVSTAAIDAATYAVQANPSFLSQPQVVRAAIGDVFGISNFGVNYTRIPPGAISALLHFHSHQDEAVFILSGHPTLCTDAGESLLAPGMFVAFQASKSVFHRIVNHTESDVIYIEIGDRNVADIVTYKRQ